ncbi:MAG: hypothetical protein IJA12_08430, partial [Oscillospiraceae bacterium]|nr:hypothetical protein [Oscillospiraceae bacterium]
MKKGKILSVLTSLAMTGSMILSAVPFTASAASPVGLELNSPKVEYSLDEIKAGATATVYVDVNTEFSSDEGVTIVEFNLTPDEWGTVDPVNLELCDPSYLATNDGSYFEYDNIDTSGSSAGSIWTKDVPETYFPIYDFYGDSNGTFAYDDAHPAKACLMTNSTLGYFRTGEGDGEHIAKFDVEFPTDLAEGTYTINLTGTRTAINTNPADVTALKWVDIENPGSITFTIGDGDVTTTTTTTDEPDVTTGTTLAKKYDAECDIWIEDQIKGEAGSKVLVPLWMDMHGETHESLGLQINYDNTALTLNKVYNSKQAGYDGTGFEGGSLKSSIKQDEGNVVILYVLKGDTPITNDPKYPVCVLEFTVSDSATGEYPLTMVNQFNPDEPIEVVHVTGSQGSPDMYFTPIVDNGSILVGEEGTTSSSSGTTTTTTTT